MTQRPLDVRAIEPRKANELHRARRAVIVDVREPDEWREARIPGAILIPIGELEARWREIPRGTNVVVQCRSGARSYHAAAFLAAQGRADVWNLDGGIGAWAAAGLPLEAGA